MDAANMLLPSAWIVPTSVAKKPLIVAMLKVSIPNTSENVPMDA